MSLQFILGKAGSGQSDRMIRELIAASMEKPEQKYIVLVPEQFTLQTQRRLVSMHPRGGILNIDVLSFERLAQRVLSQRGALSLPILTETGKNLILRRVAAAVSDQLTVFKSSLDRQGMIESVKSMLSEFTQYEITPEKLQEMIGSAGGNTLLGAKLRDLKILYEAFENYKRERFITGEELLAAFASLVKDTKELENAVLVIDEFTGFTPVQMTALRSIIKYAKEVRIALVLPENERWEGHLSESDFYYLSKKTIRGVYSLCREERAEILPPVYASGQPVSPDVLVYEAENPYEEALQAAGQIRRLIREQGCRPRQIGVIVSDMAAYEHYIVRAFQQMRIPYFIDHKVAANLNPCPELIRGVFELAEKGYSYEGMMRVLRTGFLPLGTDETDRLENYLLAAGIRGKKQWETPWERLTDAMRRKTDRQAPAEADAEDSSSRQGVYEPGEPAETKAAEDGSGRQEVYEPGRPAEMKAAEDNGICDSLRELNGYREMIMNCLSRAMEGLGKKKAKASVYTKAVRILLEDLQVEEKLQEESIRFEDLEGTRMLLPGSERLVRAMEYRQIYDVMDQILTEAEKLLGSEMVSRKEFVRILEAGLAEAKIGLIPPGLDEVYVGDLERTRLSHPQVLFLLGANDGKLPARKEKKGILSEADREYLEAKSYDLAPGLRRDIYTQRFYIHLLQRRPEKEFIISFSRSDAGGAPLRPSYLAARLRGTGNNAPEDDEAGVMPQDIREAFALLSPALYEARRTGNLPEDKKEILRGLLRSDACRRRTMRLLALSGTGTRRRPLQARTAGALYGNILTGSVSRFDTYALCPYRHFMQYGLQLREREQFRVRSADVGTLLHDALRLFFEQIRPDDLWKRISPQEQEHLAKECLQAAAQRFGKDVFLSGGRSRYTFLRSEQILKTTLQALMFQLQAGSFAPYLLEYRFDTGQNGRLRGTAGGAEDRARLVGQIDRMDMCLADDTRYLKILDYKSGSTGFSLASIYDGRELQLPVYLGQASVQMRKMFPGERIVPAGMYYCHLDDPLIPLQSGDIFSSAGADGELPGVAQQILKNLKPDGLTNPDPAVLTLFSPDERERGQIIPVPAVDRKTMELKPNSPTASEEQFLALCRFAGKKVRESAGKILEGDIRLLPYKEKKRLACEYCSYASVCGYDPRLPDAVCRPAGEGKGPEIWEKIMAEAGTADNETGI